MRFTSQVSYAGGSYEPCQDTAGAPLKTAIMVTCSQFSYSVRYRRCTSKTVSVYMFIAAYIFRLESMKLLSPHAGLWCGLQDSF